MGIPVLCNAGVGDLEEQVEALKAGWVLRELEPAGYARVAGRIDDLVQLGGEGLRERSARLFALDIAVARYAEVYRALEQSRVRA